MRVAREQVAQLRRLTRRADALERELLLLVKAHRPQLLAETGCGTLTAATLIERTAGAKRFASDASFARQAGIAPIQAPSGKRARHRLHRGGDRQLNRALHVIAITRARVDPATHAYLERKEAEGKTKRLVIAEVSACAQPTPGSEEQRACQPALAARLLVVGGSYPVAEAARECLRREAMTDASRAARVLRRR